MKLTNKSVPISALRISKLNWERELTKEDIADLAANIEEFGNLHPVVVRSVGKAGRMFEVLAGRRRLGALQLLGHTKVDVRVVKCDDIRAEIISYSENLKIKKPGTRAWAAGLARLVELYEKLHKVGTPKRTAHARKVNKSDDIDDENAETGKPKDSADLGDFAPDSGQNSGKSPKSHGFPMKPKRTLGRPKKPKTQAIKKVAKQAGVSEQSVRDALKRHGDLIASATRALDLKKITQAQADMLAKMPIKKQQMELRNMVIETRKESRDRLTVENTRKAEDKEDIISDMLASIFLDCKDLKGKLNTAIKTVEGLELNTRKLTKIPNYKHAVDTRNALVALFEFLGE